MATPQLGIVGPGKTGLLLARGVEPPSDPSFVHGVALDVRERLAAVGHERFGVLAEDLGRFGYLPAAHLVRDRTRQAALRASSNVEISWDEPPPCPSPAGASAPRSLDDLEPVYSAAEPCDAEDVRIAVVERAWSSQVAQRVSKAVPLPAVPAVDAYRGHGDRAVLQLVHGPQAMAPSAQIGLFTTLREEPDGTVRDCVENGISEALLWLRADRPAGKAILLVQMQRYFMVPQFDESDLPNTEDEIRPGADQWRHLPAGRVCAGPIDASPPVRHLLYEAVGMDVLVVVPAGNGRRNLDRTSDVRGLGEGDPMMRREHSLFVRVGASYLDPQRGYRALPASSKGGMVHLNGDGWRVPGWEYVGANVEPSPIWWGGTSAAASQIGGLMACLHARTPRPRDVIDDLVSGARSVAGVGDRPRHLLGGVPVLTAPSRPSPAPTP